MMYKDKVHTLSYGVVCAISAFVVAVLFILLRMLKDVNEMSKSFVINGIVVFLLVLVGYFIGNMLEKFT